jgi:hypothetical protein
MVVWKSNVVLRVSAKLIEDIEIADHSTRGKIKLTILPARQLEPPPLLQLLLLLLGLYFN